MKQTITYFNEVIETIKVGSKEYYVYLNGFYRVYESIDSFMLGMNGNNTHVFESKSKTEVEKFLEKKL